MSQSPNSPKVWLYDGGTWQQIEDPIDWGDGGAMIDFYEKAGYCDKYHQPVSRVEGPKTGEEFTGLTLWMREERPQCVIDLEWSGRIQSVYAARFPDGLDLMAKWAPIFHHGKPPTPSAP